MFTRDTHSSGFPACLPERVAIATLSLGCFTGHAEPAWQTGFDSQASNFRFLENTEEGMEETPPAESDILSFTFNSTAIGDDLALWARVALANTAASGSIYWRLNGGSWQILALDDGDVGNSWSWALVNGVDLREGKNSLEIAPSEPGLKLDSFKLQADMPGPIEVENALTYSEHAEATFPPEMRGQPEAAADADADRDGVPNLIEFAAHTDLLDPTDNAPLKINLNPQGPQFSFSFNKRTAGATLNAQVSPDLTSWEAAEIFYRLEVVDETRETLTVRATSRGNSLAGRMFFRLNALSSDP